MNRIEITDNAQFRAIIREMKESAKKISDIFDRETHDYEIINATDTWTGRSQEATYNQLKKLSLNYDPIRYSLALYIRFLEKTIDDYELMEKAINDNAEEFSEELNINTQLDTANKPQHKYDDELKATIV